MFKFKLKHCKTWSLLGFSTWSPALSLIHKQSTPPTFHLEPETVFFADIGITPQPLSE